MQKCKGLQDSNILDMHDGFLMNCHEDTMGQPIKYEDNVDESPDVWPESIVMASVVGRSCLL